LRVDAYRNYTGCDAIYRKNQMKSYEGLSGRMARNEKATEGNRTLDPPLTKRLLCRLSYGGMRNIVYLRQNSSVGDYSSKPVKMARNG
jgi:hypothetical protein